MKNEWAKYLDSIGIKDLFLKRVEEILVFYQTVYPDHIEDIFITEYLDADGNRQYESLWLFSETAVMEAKRFLKDDDFDFTPLKEQVEYWNIKKTEYDFQDASPKSRMTLLFVLATGISCILKASRENCDHLKSLFLKHILRNALRCPGSAQ